MKRLPLIVLALLSGLLSALAWVPYCTLFIFVAWVPLFVLAEKIKAIPRTEKRPSLMGLSYLTFLIWNLLVTWWVCFASFGGAVLAILANSLLMAAVYWLYYVLTRRYKSKLALWVIIPLWLSFEYLHTDWDLTWTWLTLGNVFAFQHNWVQWYEYTGVSGGSLWVMLINLLVYSLIYTPKENKKLRCVYLAGTISAFMLPLLLSFLVRTSYTDSNTYKNKTVSAVIVQPNVDPYNEKFATEPEVQLNKLLEQTSGQIDSTTDYLILPETFLTEDMWENNMESSFSIRFLRENLLKKYPRLTIVSGANTVYAYGPNERPSSTARKFSGGEGYYDYFNSAIQLDSSRNIAVYHKSKLVPGVEKMPFPMLLKPLEELAINMGGTSGSLGMQKEREVFTNRFNGLKSAPVICYESIFGEYLTEYIHKGAHFIFIVTNDGWWEDTPGYKQHLAYGALRAIETRREIARSANTGISCVIDRYGDIHDAQAWWQKATIKTELHPENELSFYIRHGDLLSKMALIVAALLLITLPFLRFRKH